MANAFPGAVGFGADATGGRGGQIYTVNTTSGDPTIYNSTTRSGSLRAILNAKGTNPGIIIFKVSGEIQGYWQATGSMTLQVPSNTTLLFCTAPGDGCYLRVDFTIAGDNIIVRGGRFGWAENGQSLSIHSGRQNIIFDHCEFFHAGNHMCDVYAFSSYIRNITFQYCHFYGVINKYGVCASDRDTNNGAGVLFTCVDRLTLYRCVFNSTTGGYRMPRWWNVGRGEMINCLVGSTNMHVYWDEWVPPFFLSYDNRNNDDITPPYPDPEYHFLYTRFCGPSLDIMRAFQGLNQPWPSGTTMHADGIIHEVYRPNDTGDQWSWMNFTDGTTNINFATSKIFNDGVPDSYVHTDIATLEQTVWSQVGAWPRHSFVNTFITAFENNVRSEYCTGEISLPTLTGTYDTDSDNDGIPDQWETDHGLDPNVASDALAYSDNGYHWIEEYASSILAPYTVGAGDPPIPPPPPPPPISTDAYVQSTVAPTYFVSMDATQYHEYVLASPTNQTWVLDTSPPDPYTGQGCMVATGTTNTGAFNGINAQLRYLVRFSQTGTYYYWIRGYSVDDSDDSVFLGLDGSGITPDPSLGMTGAQNGRMAWMGGPTRSMDVTQTGLHYVDIWMRESGFYLDKIVLTADPTYEPEPVKSTISIDYFSSHDPFGYDVVNAFDDNASTFWWTSGSQTYPHEVQMDFHQRYRIFAMGYQTRQDTSWDGTLGSFKVYIK